MEMAAPFVYGAPLAEEATRQLRTLKVRIERERIGAREDPKTQIKVGLGGLVDVEFTVQLVQMLSGYREPALRVQSTLGAIVAAVEHRQLDMEKGRWLAEAYRFLNRVRNTLSLIRGRPTDSLPASPEELESLARALRYGSPGARVSFLEDYRRITRRARRVCEDVFYGGTPVP